MIKKPSSNDNTENFLDKNNSLDGVMKILFNKNGKQRLKVGYELNKLLLPAYLIQEKGKEKLDLLYESLKKAKTEQELRDYLNTELNKLQNDVLGNGNENSNINGGGNNGWENLRSIENKAERLVSEQYIYKQAKLYGVTDNRQIAYILAIVKGACGFKNIKEIGGENTSYGQVDSSTGKGYYGRLFLQLTHKGNYEK